MWIVYAFCSAFFAGITAVLAKLGIKNVDSDVATALRTIVVLLFSWLIVFITGAEKGIGAISLKNLTFLVLSGLATGASWLFYFKAIQLGDVNKVAPVDKSSTVMSIVLAVIILGEPIYPLKVFGMAMILFGTMLMISKSGSETKRTGSPWLFYAVLSAVFAALTSILGKIGMSDINSDLGTAIRTGVVLVMAWLVVGLKGKTGEIRHIDTRSLRFIMLSGIATGASWLCYYKALQSGEAGIVVPIDKLSIVVTTAFSGIILKERISKRTVVGLTILTFGTLSLLL